MIVVGDGQDLAPGSRGAAVAIGNFDGVHLGHRALLAEARERAAELKAPSAVLVFEPHPRTVFRPEEPHFPLTPLPRKLALIERGGIDVVFVQKFDRAFAEISHDAFLSDILVKRLGARHVVVGYDFYFGKSRKGTPHYLAGQGQRLGYGTTIVAPVADGGEVVSSTAIRLLLAQGDVADAARLLGEPWRVRGTVIGGAKRGTGLGYPTANVPMPRGTALGHGIYAVLVHLDGRKLDGAAYLGTRPTFDDGMPVLEVFLLDFDGDLYGREIEVEFVGFVRPDRKFDGPAKLVAQMDRDVADVRGMLARVAASRPAQG